MEELKQRILKEGLAKAEGGIGYRPSHHDGLFDEPARSVHQEKSTEDNSIELE